MSEASFLFRRKGYLITLIAIPPFLVLMVWACWKGSAWPDRVCYIVGWTPPLILITVRAWNRIFRRGYFPATWPEGSVLQRRIVRLQSTLFLAFVASFAYLVYTDLTDHRSPRRSAAFMICLSFQCWDGFLKRYIADRKFIPPPPAPSPAPKGGWSGNIQGLHSDHWGGRQTPNPD